MFLSHQRFLCQLVKKWGGGSKVQKKIFKIEGHECLILK
jgi:hypothetical protein